MNKILTVEQAYQKLYDQGITSSIQVVRRWIRQGKIKAEMNSRKEGYIILQKDLEEFCKNYVQKKASINIDYNKGFEDGQKKAWEEIKQRDKDLISRHLSVFDKQHRIERASLKEKAGRAHERYKKEFLKFIDKELFSRNIKTPRKEIYFNELGEWIWIIDAYILFDKVNLLDQDMDIVDSVENTLIEYLYKKFLSVK